MSLTSLREQSPQSRASKTGVSLAAVMDEHTVRGTLWRAEGERIRCHACGHQCLIAGGRRGACKARFNRGGELRVPFGYVAGLACDPVEKKPFFHFLPGSDALTFGMMGCDFHCSYCQNWMTSQALRDPAAVAPIRPITPEQIVRLAREAGARMIVSSYNEPLITAEWAVEVFRHAGEAGLPCAFVSNGNLTPEVLEFIRPWIAACKIDLKSFQDRHYRTLGGVLEKVTDGIRMVQKSGLWLEVVTLLIPGFNNSDHELRDMAGFLASVSPDIPWHLTAFHPDYNLLSPRGTTAEDLVRAAEIGRQAGLRHVYAGNLPGRVGRLESTFCAACGETLVERRGYNVSRMAVENGKCPKCDSRVPGVWSASGLEKPQ
jgi:pyruvate formate lyase activating enzyme